MGGPKQGALGELLSQKASPLTVRMNGSEDPWMLQAHSHPEPLSSAGEVHDSSLPSQPGVHPSTGGRRSGQSRAWREWVTVRSSRLLPPGADPSRRPRSEPPRCRGLVEAVGRRSRQPPTHGVSLACLLCAPTPYVPWLCAVN